MSHHKKGNIYYIVAIGGRTSKMPFPHPTLREAQTEAERLARTLAKGSCVYVYAAYFKIVIADNGDAINTYLRYKKRGAKLDASELGPPSKEGVELLKKVLQ
jgi:hypothetical protein